MGRRTQRWRIVNRRRRFPADERGVALVEFVLVLPLILLLMLGMIDFGKAFNYWNDETHLANEAARYGVVNRNPFPQPPGFTGTWDLEHAIKEDADTGELKDGCGGCSIATPGINVQFCFVNGITPADTQAGQPLRATVSANYHWLAYLVGRGLPAQSGLTGSATMRIETDYKANPANPSDYTGNAYLKSGPVKC
jgi:Flp pilus assembly pilin Flp